MSAHQSLAQLPWQVPYEALLREAADVRDAGAIAVFVIDDQIPAAARSGYAALVMAYAREHEPVAILDDGTAVLLVREGGVNAATIAASRVLAQIRRLSLQDTLRAGVAPLANDPGVSVERARATAATGTAGEVAAG
jgi:hypothetical protein